VAPQLQDPSALKKLALELGFTSVGVCAAVPPPHFDDYRDWVGDGFHAGMEYLERQLPLRESPRVLLPGVKSIVAVSLNYNQPLNHRPGEPKIARYAMGRDYHRVVREKLKKLENWLSLEFPGSSSRACVDSAPILEREYAHLAGLGWFGKNTCLIDSKRGSWFFIGLLLTSVSIATDEPSAGGCGTCRKCIDACPTGAIVQQRGRWQVDSRRCVSYLTIEHRGDIPAELEPGIGDWTFGCDVCQEVCPFNEARDSQPLRAQVTQEPGFLNVRTWPTLRQLVQVSHVEWDKTTPGSPVRRAGYEGLKRNAAINLRASSGD